MHEKYRYFLMRFFKTIIFLQRQIVHSKAPKNAKLGLHIPAVHTQGHSHPWGHRGLDLAYSNNVTKKISLFNKNLQTDNNILCSIHLAMVHTIGTAKDMNIGIPWVGVQYLEFTLCEGCQNCRDVLIQQNHKQYKGKPWEKGRENRGRVEQGEH